MHGKWLRYAKYTSQYELAFSLKVTDGWGFQVNPLCRHDITRSDQHIELVDLVSRGVFSVLGALSKCSWRGPPRWILRRGRDGYRLHFIDTDMILINTVIHTTLYNLVQK